MVPGEGNAALSVVQGAFGVGAGPLGFLKILEALRVAAGPEGPDRPACASPEADLGLCRPGY